MEVYLPGNRMILPAVLLSIIHHCAGATDEFWFPDHYAMATLLTNEHLRLRFSFKCIIFLSHRAFHR